MLERTIRGRVALTALLGLLGAAAPISQASEDFPDPVAASRRLRERVRAGRAGARTAAGAPEASVAAPLSSRDEGAIAVLEHDGSDYGKSDPDGVGNYAARADLARRFYETHGDNYDFLVVFTNFEFETGQALAFYNAVRRRDQGIGRDQVDNGTYFGSPGRLKGFIDMAALARYRRRPISLTPGDPGFLFTLHVVAHEIGHQWLAQPRFRDSAGRESSALLGQDGAHWSYLLDSDASHMYGSDWVTRPGGQFEAERVRETYSALDLYLMGLLAPDKVGPIGLLSSPLVDPTGLPREGDRITAVLETLSIGDIQSVEGPRLPDHAASQKDYRIGFILLTAPGTQPSAQDLQAVENVRQAFPSYFLAQTRGAALADTTLAESPGPPPLPTSDLDKAIAYLLAAQAPDGRWEDLPGTGARDTAAVLQALLEAGHTGPASDLGLGWLSPTPVANVDYFARRALVLAPRLAEAERTALARALLGLRNADGGFGASPGYSSDPLDTALALRALRALGHPADDVILGAIQTLFPTHLPGRGWPFVAGAEASTVVTAEVLLSLVDWREASPAQALLAPALSALTARRNPDGGFGESPSSPYATALAVAALFRAGAGESALAEPLLWLQQHQHADGSWGGRRYDTALVLSALKGGSAPNLVVPADSLVLSPDSAREGDVVQVSFRVRNGGRAPAAASTARLFAGDPASGVLVGEAPVPPLAPGDEWAVTLDFPTDDRPGDLQVFVVADAAGEVAEWREDDNAASRALQVVGTLPDLVLDPGCVTVTPDPLLSGELAHVSVRVRNAGEDTNAPTVLSLVLGNPRRGGRVIGQGAIPAIPPGGQAVVLVAWDTTGVVGLQTLYAVADPGFAEVESDETNNEAFLSLEVEQTPPATADLAIARVVVQPQSFGTIPQTVSVTVEVRNRGLATATSSVALYEGDPGAAAPLAEPAIEVPARSVSTVTFSYLVEVPGTRKLTAIVDPRDLLPEEREDDNRGDSTLIDPRNTLDLELPASDVIPSPVSLTVGDTLTVSALVRNRGTAPFSGVPVSLLRADSGAELARTTVTLDPGRSTTVSLSWVAAVAGAPLSLVLRADPFGLLDELDESNNEAPIAVTVQPSALPNLKVTGADITLSPDPPLEGGSATLSALVRNTAAVPAPPFEVKFYRGDPAEGGVLIGTASPAGLAPGEATTVSVVWSPVNARGAIGLVVVADPAGVLAEFDETDNRAFRPLTAIGLPDLAVTAGDLQFTPGFPRAGQNVAVRAVVRNLGAQPSGASLVRAFEGEPASGLPLGQYTLPPLGPGAVFPVTFDWTPAGDGDRTLSIVVDPDATSSEADEGNNLGRRSVVVQNADLYLTAPYFSPNGDGVLDETTLAWRATGPVSVVVSDSNGQDVRTLVEGAPAEGSVLWDGRDRRGVLLFDGAYTLSVLGAGGAPLGRAEAVLDTNRSPIHEAAGTQRVASSNLTCALGQVSGPAFLPSEEAALVVVQSAAGPDTPVGLARVSLEGDHEYLFADPWYAPAWVPGPGAVSPDVRLLALGRYDGLYLVDLVGGARTLLEAGSFHSGNRVTWSPDGAAFAGFGNIYARDGTVIRSIGWGDWVWSPDGRYLARGTTVVSRDDVTQWWSLPLPPSLGFNGVRQTDWMPDGRVFTVIQYQDDSIPPGLECTDGCALFYTPFDESYERFAEYERLRSGWSSRRGSWSPAGDRLLLQRTNETTGNDVTSVMGRDGAGLLDLTQRPVEASPHASLAFYDEAAAADSPCFGQGPSDIVGLLSLDNLTVDVRAGRLSGDAGLLLRGTASDRNLDRWQLDYASVTAPDSWLPLGPSFDVPVLDDVLMPWVPPSPGTYALRLRAWDRAGNSRAKVRLVAWDKSPVLANVTQSEFLISPNGDGVKDEAGFGYLALVPTAVTVNVFGPEPSSGTESLGPLVRVFQFQHLAPESQVFAWDGRDGSGQLVADGAYTVLVEGLPFRVEVDNTPPAAGWAWTDLRIEMVQRFPQLRADRLWHVLDANLKSWTAVLIPYEDEFRGTQSVYEPERDALGSPVYENGRPKPKYVDGHPANVRRVEAGIARIGVRPATFRAVDHAGNVSLAPILPVDQRLYLALARDTGSDPPRERIERPVQASPPYLLPPKTSFYLYETLRGETNSQAVRFQYQLTTGGPVAEVPFEARKGFRQWDADLGTLGLDPEGVYNGRFACDNADGPFTSEEFQFRPCDRYGRLDGTLLPSPPGERKMLFKASGYASSPLVAAELSLADEYGRLLSVAPLPLAAPDRFEQILQLPEGACRARAVLTAADGSLIKGAGDCRSLDVDLCDECRVEVMFREVEGQCGVPNQYAFVVSESCPKLYVVEGDPDTNPFEIGRFVGPRFRNERFVPHRLATDVADRPEGAFPIRVTVYGEEGGAKVGEFRFMGHVDKTKPVAEVFQPVEGETLCSNTNSLKRPPLTFTVRAQEASPEIRIALDLRQAGRPLALSGNYSGRDIPRGEILPQAWELTGPVSSGKVDAQVSFCDAAGNTTLVARSFFLRLEQPSVKAVSIDRHAFSPNDDGKAETATATFGLAEALRVTTRVHVGAPSGPIVRTLSFETLRPAGDFDVTWDGRDQAGSVLPDGGYWIEAVVKDGCGEDGAVSLPVALDNTPPLAQIVEPAPLAWVFGSVDVLGAARDLHPGDWRLESRPEGGTFTTFATGNHPVGTPTAAGRLARWDTPPATTAAVYELRLTVTDAALNSSQALLPVTLEPKVRLDRLTAEPALFSPNGDGRRESTTVAYTLLAPARVRLLVKTPLGVTVRTLEVGAEHDAGTYAFAWNGLDDALVPAPDGEYRVAIRAEEPGGGGSVEEISIVVTVDRVAPVLSIASPGPEGFVDRSSSVAGSIEDEHMGSWSLLGVDEAGAPVELATGVGNKELGALASLSRLAEGRQTLRLQAEDLAENRSERTVPFTVDSTPPLASIDSPLPGSHWSKKVPVEVVGVATDQNLTSWQLFAGRGPDPASFFLVRESSTGGTGITLGPWAVASLPDDEYTLQLVATDRAGHRSEARSTVVVDGTPPVVSIANPAEAGYMKAAGPVSGTASDLYLVDYRLEAAPGPAGAAYEWAPIGGGTASVTAGVLADWSPLPPEGLHTLRLSAKDRAGNESSVVRTVTVDTTPPAPPVPTAKVDRMSATEGRILLTWPPNTEDDLAGYRVFRVEQSATIPLTGLTPTPAHTDPGKPEGVYRYEVVAEDLAGNVSMPGKVAATVNLAPPQAEILSPAEGASVSGSMPIRGTAWSLDDFKEYRLSIGAGASPASFSPLRRSTLSVQGGTLGEWTALGDGPFVLRLEAEDTYGNVARAERTVIVDNAPPLAPVLTAVDPVTLPVAQPDALFETWLSSPSPDVIGYLVYRNGRIANAPAITLGDLRPYLVPPPTHLDPSLPDGEHCYRVAAMDGAGNLSAPSNQICRTLENRPPVVEIVTPPSGLRFEFPIQVTAFTPDLDVRSVQFQLRSRRTAPDPPEPWQDLGAADVQAPWTTPVDPAARGLSLGAYELRALARDGVPLEGESAPVTVFYADTTPPAPPLALSARVDGRAIRLTWDGNAEPDLAGYHVYRGELRLTTTSVPASTYDDDRDPGAYEYTVTAVDADGNESGRSNVASAIVYEVALEQPFPVTLDAQVGLGGVGRADTTIDILRDAEVVASGAAPATTFFVPAVPLQPGVNLPRARGRDAAGNRSIVSSDVVVIANTAPGAVTELVGSAAGGPVQLSWLAPADADLFGHLLRRDGEPLRASQPARDSESVTASSVHPDAFDADAAFDDDDATVWAPAPADQAPLWSVVFPTPILVETIELTFVSPETWSPHPIRAYDVEALWEGRYLRVAGAASNTDAQVSHALPFGFATRSIRLRLRPEAGAGLAEVRITRADPIESPTNAYEDQAPLKDGTHVYEVASLDRYGALGPWTSATVEIDRLSKPTGLVGVPDGSDAVLTWNPNPEPDISHYVVYRFGVAIGETGVPTSSDPGLANGDYVYTVTAVDTDGNESEPSDSTTVTIAVSAPVAPVLAAGATPQGAIQLTWAHPGAAKYVLSRSLTRGGPHAALVTVTERTYLDTAVTAGVEHFYVVTAFDTFGNPSPASNEASATSQRTEPPVAPVILFPTAAAHPIQRLLARTPVRGRTESGTEVALSVNGQFREIAAALAPFTEQPLVTYPEDHWQLAVSLDGKRVVRRPLDSTGSPLDLRLEDLATAETSLATLDPWTHVSELSPDADRLLYLARGVPTSGGAPQYDLHLLDLGSGQVTVLEDGPQSVFEATWARDGARVAFVTSNAEGACALQVTTLASADTQPVPAGDGCPMLVQWSFDATRLAFAASYAGTSEVRWTTPSGGPVETVSAFAGAPRFTPDGRLLFIDGISGRVVAHDPDTGMNRSLTDGSSPIFDLAVDPRGEWISTQSDMPGGVRVTATSLLTGESRVVADWPASLLLHTWTTDGSILVASSDGRRLVTYPGYASFTFPQIALSPGPNTLVARATDPASGLESADSEAVQVTVPEGLFPDPAVAPEDVASYPPLPRVGQPVALRARVRNLGSVPATSVSVRLSLADTALVPLAETRVVLASVAAGASTTVTLPWTPSVSGRYLLGVVVDEEGSLVEVREDNNAAGREIVVPEAAGLLATIEADRVSYPSRTPAVVAARVVNSAGPFAGRARVAVEDPAGTEVALLDDRTVALAYGDTLDYTVDWNTGTTYAGDYTFRLHLTDDGAPAGQAAHTFVIRPDIFASVRLQADRFRTPQNEAATFAAQVGNEGENAPLAGAVTRFLVRRVAAPGEVVYETQAPLGSLLPLASRSLHPAWPTAAPAGAYQAEMRVEREGVLLASATADFEVEAPVAHLTGTIATRPGEVLQGDVFDTPFTVTNTGGAALAGLPLVVEVVSGPTAAVVLTQTEVVDLPAGGSRSAEPAFSSASLSPGEYVVRLRPAASTASLARASLRVRGLLGPPSIHAPADGAVASTPRPELMVNNGSSAEGAALTYQFELFSDSALTLQHSGAQGILEAPLRTGFSLEEPLDEDSTYWWRARVSDGFSFSAWSHVASFTVDATNLPPDPPVPDSPRADVTVATRQPVLVARNAFDAEQDPLTYEFRLGKDETLAEVLASTTGIAEGAGRTSWLVPVLLAEDERYCWSTRASDPRAASDWSVPACFRVESENGPPAAPTPLRPIGGVHVDTLSPALVAGPATDPEDTPLVYRFELDTNPSFGSLGLQTSPSVPGGGAEISWTAPLALQDNTAYHWRVAARDGTSQGPWAADRFFVNLGNDLPTAPVLLDPVDERVVSTGAPTLTWRNASDLDGDLLRYEVEVTDALGTSVARAVDLAESPQQTAWTVLDPLTENARYEWRARAHDGFGPGPWSAPAAFRVNAVRQPPTAPVPTSPPEGATLDDRRPTLVVTNATSPDGLALTYTFELYQEDGGILTLVDSAGGVAEGAASTSFGTAEDLPNASYAWRSRAFDGELFGPWSDTARFRVAVDEPPAPPIALAATPGDSRVDLTWNASPEPDVAAYGIYRALVAGGPYAAIGEVPTPAYADTGLTNGVTYYYVVTAQDATYESGPSNEAAATPFAVSGVVPAEVRYTPQTVPGECLDPEDCGCSWGSPVHATTGGSSSVRPILECVVANADNSFTALFGYLNESAVPVDIAIGSQNKFTPQPQDRGQPRTFAPGRTAFPLGSFSVDFWSGNQVWKLRTRTATASAGSKRCSVSQPQPECPNWVYATIELPDGHDVAAIDLASVRLGGVVPAQVGWSLIVDQDADGRPERKVRFAFSAVRSLLAAGSNTLVLSGLVGGLDFEGSSPLTVLGATANLFFTPRSLKLSAGGQEVQADLAFAPCVLASQVDLASLRLNETVPIRRVLSSHGSTLKVKFDRAAVAAILAAGAQVEIRVSGAVAGKGFVARDLIKVIP